MITIRFRKNKDEYLSFEVDGHAGFDEIGKDIVCAGVSAIAYMGINALAEVAKISDLIYEVGEDGYAYCELPADLTRDQWKKSQTILETVFVGFQGIELTYSEYIKIRIEEVHPDAKS
jgi:hypothetical protein